MQQANDSKDSGAKHEPHYDKLQHEDDVASYMYTLDAKEAKKYYLCKILLHVRGAKSFEYIRRDDAA